MLTAGRIFRRLAQGARRIRTPGNTKAQPTDARRGALSIIESLENRVFLAANIPGTIQVEDYDAGGEGAAYHDLTRQNVGGAYRPKDGVDIAQIATEQYAVMSTQAKEWLQYTLNVQEAGKYDVSLFAKPAGIAGTIQLKVDGKKSGIIVLTKPTLGAVGTWTTFSGGAVELPAGLHRLRLGMASTGSGKQVGRLDWFSLTLAAPAVPTLLIASSEFGRKIALTWQGNSKNQTGFQIERADDPDGPWEKIAQVPSNVTSYTDAGIVSAHIYYYRVLATNGSLNSSYSTLVSAVSAQASTPTDTFSGPIVITHGGTYSGRWESIDPDVPAVSVRTNELVIIENSAIQSRGTLIDASGFKVNLTVNNTSGFGLNPDVAGRYPGRFLDVDGFVNVLAENNDLENTSGIYLYGYEGNHTSAQTVKILRNVVNNVDGRISDGVGGWQDGAADPDNYKQFFQIDGVSGLVGAEVGWNQVINQPGQSRVEESVNIHASSGTASSPFLIHENYIQGAYPANDADAANYTGGGIMVSDNGSSFIQAFNNQIVATGSIGIVISSGHDNVIYNNRIISSGLAADGFILGYSNTGVAIWNFNGEPTFANNSGHDNVIGWMASGERNDWWVPDAASWVNNSAWPSKITLATEGAEWNIWQQKLAGAGAAVGPETL